MGGGGGGGVRAKVEHLNFVAIFWSNSRPLGLENSSNLIKYPHLAPVVQTMDSGIRRINHYSLDNSIGFACVYPRVFIPSIVIYLVDCAIHCLNQAPIGWIYFDSLPYFQTSLPRLEHVYSPQPSQLPVSAFDHLTTVRHFRSLDESKHLLWNLSARHDWQSIIKTEESVV